MFIWVLKERNSTIFTNARGMLQFAQPAVLQIHDGKGCVAILHHLAAHLSSAYHHCAHKGSVKTSYHLAALTFTLYTSSTFAGGTGN